MKKLTALSIFFSVFWGAIAQSSRLENLSENTKILKADTASDFSLSSTFIPLGSNSVTSAANIIEDDAVIMPVTGSNSITTCGATIYDNGGKANYALSSDGVLTIYPETAGSAVKLKFSEFNVYTSDDLYIYNGINTSASQIGYFYGTTIPADITATNSNGALTLRFKSTEYSTSASGFIAQTSCVPLVSQYITSVSWSNPVDINLNTYAQSKTLYFNVKNDGASSATIYAKVYSKISSESSYTLLNTLSFIVGANAVLSKNIIVSGFNTQNSYDFKIELYNGNNNLLNTYDLTNNSLLGVQKFESASDDILPSYCISGLSGGNFNITAVSISETTLNNSAVRPTVKTSDNSYYTFFAPTESNTCTLVSGNKYTLNVTTKDNNYIAVWIDYNQDLTFQSNECTQVVGSTIANSQTSIPILIPGSALPGQTRMRIRSNYYLFSPTDPCTYFSTGCTEDYNISIVPPVLALPVADFETSPTKVSIGSTIQFNDLSKGAPASWLWTFEGGTPSSSTSQNPLIQYNTAGTFDVKLVIKNSLGTDSVTKAGYINVVNTVNVPSSGSKTITACGVTVYDNGGTSNYANSTNGVLTIYPVSIENAVRLQFSEFNTETSCDYLMVYNGTSTSASVIGNFSGTTIPQAIVATNPTGALTLKFYSDGSSVNTGFVAQASCVPLFSQYIASASWSNSVDNNYNGYAQKRTFNCSIQNDDVNSATLYAKIYYKLSSDNEYSLFSTTSNFTVNGNTTTAAPTFDISGFTIQSDYDIKIEIYNLANKLLSTYDKESNKILSAVKFESVPDDGVPVYCVNNLGGGSFDISTLSIIPSTLNNTAVRPTVRTIDGSFYNEFAPAGSNTCSLMPGSSYSLNITTKNADKISVWIDYNQDSLFQSNEWLQVAALSVANRVSSAIITVPDSAKVGQTRMRVRTTNSNNSNIATDACTGFTSGCTEDYIINIAASIPAKPVTDFIASATETAFGNSINFYDISTGIPESWKWTFQGGTPSTSTGKNPKVFYSTSGKYDVKLVTTNQLGADSIVKTGYITISNSVNVPSTGANFINACDITIYDNGGKSNYSASSDGMLTVYPVTAGNSVRLQFSEFSTYYNDYLYIYNGINTSAPQIGYYSGSSIPSSVRATNSSGALTLRFVTYSSYNTYSGFVAQATCVPLALQNVISASWSNNIDNNYNSYNQSRNLNIITKNSSSVSSTIYAKVYYKLSTASTYNLVRQTGNITISANSDSETILCNISNMPSKGYYDFKIELYDTSNTLISSYDLIDNTNLKSQAFESASDDGLASYCSYLGGSSYDITSVSISGTTLNNNTTRPATGAYYSYSPSGNFTGSLKLGSTNTINVSTTNNDIVSVWIDFDHNGLLESAEWTQVSIATNGNPASASLYVPANALIGPTRLRVRTRSAGTSNYSTDACTQFSSGCTEDYVVTLEKPTGTGDLLNSEFILYPNPAKNVINISIPGLTSGTLHVTDMLGRNVIIKEINSENFSEDVSNLTKGIYIFNVNSDNGTSFRKQVIIQR